jgi:hypothetical protein
VEAVTFHLLGGVSQEEAEAVEREHGHAWVECNKCPGTVVAAVLIRNRLGGIDGFVVCSKHEAEILEMIESSEGYVASGSA